MKIYFNEKITEKFTGGFADVLSGGVLLSLGGYSGVLLVLLI